MMRCDKSWASLEAEILKLYILYARRLEMSVWRANAEIKED